VKYAFSVYGRGEADNGSTETESPRYRRAISFDQQLSVVGKLLITERFLILAEFGRHKWDLDDYEEMNNQDVIRFTVNDGTNIFYGVGAEVTFGTHCDFCNHWRLGINVTRYKHPFEAEYYRYVAENSLHNPHILEYGSHTDVIELTVTWFWGSLWDQLRD